MLFQTQSHKRINYAFCCVFVLRLYWDWTLLLIMSFMHQRFVFVCMCRGVFSRQHQACPAHLSVSSAMLWCVMFWVNTSIFSQHIHYEIIVLTELVPIWCNTFCKLLPRVPLHLLCIFMIARGLFLMILVTPWPSISCHCMHKMYHLLLLF